ncbi:hypothetical protein L208DRAFT_1078451, partial [Tricholoma matsutake]
PEIPTKRFLADLVTKHDERLMAEREWTCWTCSKSASCTVHAPCSYLHLPNPMVMDFVCVPGGACDRQAREFFETNM